ncbi:MAG TPA: ARMT1-like domain-containing protein [Candidatus Methanofastidiosa archaeon]|nr:ARMT1-like domain-containing protein [Candidatus Methanofastidiosa archaeon]HPR41582.1 ARMT1-like domain-containing protein [Candidatus Methanofastidiosa archaeon]
MNLECIPCFQRQAIHAARMATDDQEMQAAILKKVVNALISMEWDQPPPKLAQVVHRIVRTELGTDPYSKVKEESNERALALYDHMKDRVSGSDDPVLTAVKVAIAGNVMDFGPYSDFDFDTTLAQCLDSDLEVNHCREFKDRCKDSPSVLYLVDNAGEVVCDRILIETINDVFSPKRITIAVKGGNILNDATYMDIEQVGLNDIRNVDIICVSNGEPFTGVPRESHCFRKIMDNYAMIISKGQGNYEMLSSNDDIFFLLKAKCGIIAQDIGVPIGSMVCGKML